MIAMQTYGRMNMFQKVLCSRNNRSGWIELGIPMKHFDCHEEEQ